MTAEPTNLNYRNLVGDGVLTVGQLRELLVWLPDDTRVLTECEVGGYYHNAEVTLWTYDGGQTLVIDANKYKDVDLLGQDPYYHDDDEDED